MALIEPNWPHYSKITVVEQRPDGSIVKTTFEQGYVDAKVDNDLGCPIKVEMNIYSAGRVKTQVVKRACCKECKQELPKESK